ncbi:type I restriction-modification system subunit M [Shewanella colwelliana]|uniref:type I restriction-modification system subunit M n=1 Tax=Shewanella colwelliana TaxID=23 RepID=UPI003D07B171
MVEQHQQELKKQLWNIANTLRGNMSADDFRDYILGLIFYKYLSDKLNRYADLLLKQDGLHFAAIDEQSVDGQEMLDDIKEETLDNLGYFFKPSELFHVIAERGKNDKFILDDVTKVLNHIEQSTMGAESADDFNGLFDELDLTSNKLGKTPDARNKLIAQVLVHLDNINFHLENSEIDILGDAYEYLIGMFASGAGKKAGEFYTPQMVSKLLAKLVTLDNANLKSVYDPTCGSGSLLLRVAKEANNPDLKFYGQEQNPSTYNLARMNMIMHDVHYTRFDIQNDDTLETPLHFDERFDAVVANPPFSADWSASPLHLNNDRFADYGKLAPKGKADFAFVQHMVHQLNDNGTMAVVLPHGVLFRGAAEGHIRKHLIKEKNYLDMVIGLPANIFFGTSIPTCVLVLKKHRKVDDNILFIDASAHFEKSTNNNVIREEDLARILNAVTKRENMTEAELDKFAFVATQKDLRDNDYNLNIPRYVDTFEEVVIVDLSQVAKQLVANDVAMLEVDKTITDFCKELGIEAPFGVEK